MAGAWLQWMSSAANGDTGLALDVLSLYACALGVGPLPLGELADVTATDPDALLRLPRFLSGIDVVSHQPDGVLALTALGATLADGPGSVRALAAFWMQIHYIPFAAERLTELGVADRVKAVGGDFFTEVPSADVYLLSTVLHDWNDDQCATILANIARAAHPGARLVVLEAVLPDTDAPHPAKFNDLAMLGVGAGRERSHAEYAELLATAGFTPTRHLPGPSYNPFSLLEARLEARVEARVED
ncbi:methyltransferase [Streptomyces sp. NPDC088789]|uniref:methyltransferase n=1 Tax=Streptomyces sp. NPDC088789 TaxID=3365899 RepID=UPI0037F61A9D